MEAASIMCALTINDDNKMDIAQNDQMMENLIALLNHPEPRCIRQAMGCVANISERHDTHPYLRKHNVHALVLHHFDRSTTHPPNTLSTHTIKSPYHSTPSSYPLHNLSTPTIYLSTHPTIYSTVLTWRCCAS